MEEQIQEHSEIYNNGNNGVSITEPQITQDDVIAIGIQHAGKDSTGNKIYKASVITVWGIFSAVVASPTAFLNFLARLNVPVDSLNSITDLKDLWTDHSLGELAYAGWSAACSEGVNTTINFVYFGPALNKTKDLVLKAFNLCRKQTGEKPLETIDWIDVVSVIWAAGTSLPFGQLAKDEFDFMGEIPSYIPFSLNFLAYYVTRFNGVEGVLRGLFDGNAKFRDKLIKEAIGTKCKGTTNFYIDVDINNPNVRERLSHALVDFFTQLLDDKESPFSASYFERNRRGERLNLLANIIGVPAALIFAASVWPVVTQKTIQGLESITKLDIGKHAQYQNAVTYGVGYPTSAPTTFFYGRTILNVPDQFKRFCEEMYKRYQNSNYLKLAAHAGLQVFIMYLSYESGKGWQGVAETIIEEGYLGGFLHITEDNALGTTLPYLTAAAASLVNYSILSKTQVSAMSSRDPEKITQINLETALYLLSYGLVDSAMLKNGLENHSFFKQSSRDSFFSMGTIRNLRQRSIAQRRTGSEDDYKKLLEDSQNQAINIANNTVQSEQNGSSSAAAGVVHYKT